MRSGAGKRLRRGLWQRLQQGSGVVLAVQEKISVRENAGFPSPIRVSGKQPLQRH